MLKTLQCRTTLGSSDLEKVHAVVARSTFWSQNVKNIRGSDHFWGLRCRFAWQKHEIVDLVKSEQNMKVLQHFDIRWQAWDIWRWSAKTHFPWPAQYKRHVHERGWEVRVLISWEGYILEYQKCRFAKMILHDRCNISYDVAASFRGRRNTLDRWSRNIAKRIGTRVRAQHWSFHFWRKSRTSRPSLMLST